MARRILSALLCAGLLAGCGGNPFTEGTDGGGGETPGTGTIPAALKGNLQSVSYNPNGGAGGNGALTAVIDPLDASPVTATFDRAPTLDTPGYKAFTYRETSSNRLFVALLATSASGDATAGVLGSGQFTEMVWGSTYQADGFVKPQAGGLASYKGNYVGIQNRGAAVPGPGAPFNPIQAYRVEGDVLLNADFTNNSVEGGIRNRQVVDTSETMADLFLQITEIKADGTFGGTVVFADKSPSGTYGGAFGGTGATAVAGAIEVGPEKGNNDLLERGIFVADRCAPGDPLPCPQ
ncbi:hypothetical protein [Neotabrizicola sp. sgz301269]|uniref:hypothetical protein n=1 Tax=Neotabrizicola sp. sgz301269 TaxID=3276282 RepID=UPI00376FEB6E